jgi:NADPH:quinone reductase-like Zn-dependent oxidoreductase
MKAIVIDHYGGTEQLHVRELPDPRPHADEVLVRVRAAGVNPVDWKICQGQLRFILRLNFPYIPGGDMAGEVVAAGADVAQFWIAARFCLAQRPRRLTGSSKECPSFVSS